MEFVDSDFRVTCNLFGKSKTDLRVVGAHNLLGIDYGVGTS